jgi:hypothetical protein
MIVKIRYKTDAKPEDTLHWRVIVDGVEHHASKVIINCMTYTTKDIVENGVEKWHITCTPQQIQWLDQECILI